ncbi:hypothetical protein POM88_039106 [Heracleum sosnowskyi]|uniref:Uncharacterized protein n=1 Tax=Heracleum sosnowskyi TaxID=360622 RepID=A0AAD8H9S0_9APIA|nr:hypothetical protein POM88_039106 [Heracleum sosnowskyi]
MEKIEKPYGVWMRAEPRRKSHTMGAKWLRPGGITPAASTVNKGIGEEIISCNSMIRTGGSYGNNYSVEQKEKNRESITAEAGINNVTKIMELIINDPRRIRTERPKLNRPRDVVDHEEDIEMALENNGMENQKNLLVAGAARQTRQSS